MRALVLGTILLASDPAPWSGVDETVVGRLASEAGRPPRRPLLDTDQGDLLLFAFLSAGIVGGFALGYAYRLLFVERADAGQGEKRET